MAAERNSDDTDTGISYREAPSAIQKLLDKVKARKIAVGEETDRSRNGLPQIAFARGEYAGRFYENLNKARGYSFLQRKADKSLMMPFLTAKPPAEHSVLPLWQSVRNTTARKIRGIKKADKLLYRNLAGLSSKLDELIEFAGKLPFKTVKSVGTSPLGMLVRKMKNKSLPPRLDFKKRPPANWGEMHRRLSGYRFSERLDGLIQLETDMRPRNNLGEFVPPAEGGPDRNAIATTYQTMQPQPQPKQSKMSREIGQAVLAAPLVGAGGTAGGLAVKELFKKLNTRKALRKPI